MAKVEVLYRGFDHSPAIDERVQSKIGKVIDKLGQRVTTAHMSLKVVKFPVEQAHSTTTKKDSQIAEVTVNLKGGAVLHASEQTEDMYASIDLVSHKMAKLLRKHHSKTVDRNQNQSEKRGNKDLPLSDMMETPMTEEDFFVQLDDKYSDYAETMNVFDLTKLEVVRAKEFPMPPITVEEATSNLELTDHPFYVFRNKVTNEVNVIYRRKHGGVGIIMPEK